MGKEMFVFTLFELWHIFSNNKICQEISEHAWIK